MYHTISSAEKDSIIQLPIQTTLKLNDDDKVEVRLYGGIHDSYDRRQGSTHQDHEIMKRTGPKILEKFAPT